MLRASNVVRHTAHNLPGIHQDWHYGYSKDGTIGRSSVYDMSSTKKAKLRPRTGETRPDFIIGHVSLHCRTRAGMSCGLIYLHMASSSAVWRAFAPAEYGAPSTLATELCTVHTKVLVAVRLPFIISPRSSTKIESQASEEFWRVESVDPFYPFYGLPRYGTPSLFPQDPL